MLEKKYIKTIVIISFMFSLIVIANPHKVEASVIEVEEYIAITEAMI